MNEVNIAIVIARGGSKRLPGKNERLIGGRPLVQYPLLAARSARHVQAFFLATDGAELADMGRDVGALILQEPPALASDTAKQADVVAWAVAEARLRLGPETYVRNVVVLLGNTVMVDGPLIDECLDELAMHPHYDSVTTVWQAEDDHPERAFGRDASGCLVPWLAGAHSSRSQDYRPAFFQDQGPWAFRSWLADKTGPLSPWTWMGERCYALVRPWVAGRDVDEEFDVEVAEWWLGRKK